MINKSILVISGPNLNLLGNREEKYYGNISLDEIHKKIKKIGNSNNIIIDCQGLDTNSIYLNSDGVFWYNFNTEIYGIQIDINGIEVTDIIGLNNNFTFYSPFLSEKGPKNGVFLPHPLVLINGTPLMISL